MHKAHSGIPLIGLDVGGTKVAAYLAVDDTIMNEIRLDTDVSSNQATAECIIRTINQVLDGTGFQLDDVGAIGVGISGMITVRVPWF